MYNKCQQKDFWIVDPVVRNIQVLLLEQDQYWSKGVFAGKAVLPSHVVPSLPVQVQQFFA
jgi:hypothetical protein